MKSLKEFFFEHTQIDDELWQQFSQNIKTVCYAKGDYISAQDNIWTEYMYLDSGLIRSFLINNKGKEFTRQFYFNTSESNVGNLFVTDFRSVLSQESSLRAFEVLEGCELKVFSHHDITALYHQNHTWERLGRIFTQLAYIQVDEYYCTLLTCTPKEHYLKLKKEMPDLCERLSQYHIASFLGISPVTLSRIKKSCDA